MALVVQERAWIVTIGLGIECIGIKFIRIHYQIRSMKEYILKRRKVKFMSRDANGMSTIRSHVVFEFEFI